MMCLLKCPMCGVRLFAMEPESSKYRRYKCLGCGTNWRYDGATIKRGDQFRGRKGSKPPKRAHT